MKNVKSIVFSDLNLPTPPLKKYTRRIATPKGYSGSPINQVGLDVAISVSLVMTFPGGKTDSRINTQEVQFEKNNFDLGDWPAAHLTHKLRNSFH
ncbi:hypothetical protein [Desulforegula conservatrix]|uniref:hypothetical protein n=1 Tax=Desulforegula conservatrix TaxID=153026 RepID=UPI0012EB281F|nr:hypothetical protein [Desulforegula conservatrix]